MKKHFITLALGFALLINNAFASFPIENKATTKKETTINLSEKVTSISELKEDVSNIDSISETKSKNNTSKVAIDDDLLVIILGFISILAFPFALHNWYLGKNGKALAQTLMMIPGAILILPAIASWIWQAIDLFVLIADY